MDNEARYRVLRLIEEHPRLTQRELAERLGISLGKVNYCLRALIDRGFVKARNFKNIERKLQYAYALTPKGVQERTRVALEFLRRKADEFDEIQDELERLQAQLSQSRQR